MLPYGYTALPSPWALASCGPLGSPSGLLLDEVVGCSANVTMCFDYVEGDERLQMGPLMVAGMVEGVSS